MKEFTAGRLLCHRENEPCNCKRCSFSQSVLPRAASLESSCEQHAEHGHANGCVAVDVHERVCRRVHRTAMAAADCDCIILTMIASRPEELEPVVVVAGEKLSQLEEVRDLQHALFAAAVRCRLSAQEFLRRANWRRHGHLFTAPRKGVPTGVSQSACGAQRLWCFAQLVVSLQTQRVSWCGP